MVAVHGDDLFTLRWRYAPDLPLVMRCRVEIGLMHPACPTQAA